MLIRKSHPLLSLINNSLIDIPSPSNINYLWNIGSLLGICLIIQILSGLFLTFHFSAHTSLSFSRVSNISRDINNGWILRLIHANGARIFFILIYTHIGRGIYFRSFFFLRTWFSGTLIFLILIGTAFFRICFTLRTNILLRSYCNYKFIDSYSLLRVNNYFVNLRRFFCR